MRIRIAMPGSANGCIGYEALQRFVNHPLLKGLPCILETPNELDGYAKEISLLRAGYR